MRRIDWAAGRGIFESDGKGLEWRRWGPPPGDAPTIALLHEGLGCVALWRDFPARLAEATGLGVFAWSRAGYGQSDPADLPRPLDYLSREAKILPRALDALGAREIILFGHSDGATIAAIHAGAHHDPRLRGLILMAPHFFTESMGLAEIAKAKTAFDTTDLKHRMAQHHRDAEATFRGWNDAWLAPGFARWNVAEVIEHWRVPVLAIQGLQDQYGTLAQIREIERRSRAPVTLALIDACRHAPHLEQPDRTLAAVADFIAGLQQVEINE
ncbi:alpha/beta hydrolase [Rhodoblastus sphagnicola]|uniref:Alpha/beta hydrolase n=1 Tax=Rhodoblastus sphagnicola TaxID=333368 RepID=A0A2S6MX40_9HYPH|nr:alpha/beta hydrolase [Rhodoblastus sphagnicola]MBB4199264.1 pimeloyl-ACP methyl ester carboxylesterase [Rhodoblastus sphagnicola]PPQ26933.1 alpha/beta hydrolase [Rhodoblastus sphagnicola]